MKSSPVNARQRLVVLALLWGVACGGLRAQQTITYTNGENNTGTITITLSANPTTLEVDNTDSATQSGVISESGVQGDVTKIGTGTLTLTAPNTYSGGTEVDNGTLEVSGAGASVGSSNSLLRIGLNDGDNGSLIVSNGGQVTNGLYSLIGYNVGGTGSVTVTGSGSSLSMNYAQLRVGNFGTGTLTIANGGTVSLGSDTYIAYGYGGSGLVTVTGTGSSLYGGTVLVIGNAGTGGLTVSNGGQASAASVRIGDAGDGKGQVTVTGAGSLLTATTSLVIGDGGTGTLTIDDGGTVKMGLTGTGGVQAGGGLNEVGTLNIGNYDLTQATTAGTLEAGTIGLSFQGGTGLINFNQTDTTTFTAAITGAGSVVQRGTGTTILTGANAYSGATTVDNGTLEVSGAGAIAGSSSLFLVGKNDGDNGSLIVSNGGQVTGEGSTYIGFSVGSTGSVTVTGSGSSLSTIALQVGHFGTGTLTIANGGTVSVGSFSYIAYGVGSSGLITVTGTGSSFQGGSIFEIGNAGTGGLTVSNGGQASAAAVHVGNGGYGQATVTGAGSVLSATTSLIIGDDGPGTLTIADGGTVEMGLTGTGGVQMGGGGGGVGTLNIGNYDLTQATTAGTLEAATVGLGFLGGTGVINFNQTDTTTFTAAISGGGKVVQRGTGTTILTGIETYTGTTAVNGGTLLVDGSLGNTAVSVNRGGTLGGSGSVAGPVTVNNGGTLMGTGTYAGTVTVLNGGILSPGDSPGTVTVGNLVLNSGSVLDYQLDTPGVAGGGVNDLVAVTGSLVLAGVLNVTPLTNFGVGTYTLFTYGGTLTDNGLLFGVVPGGYDFAIATASGSVTLTVGTVGIQYWNGTTTSPDGTVQGGDGTWDSSTTNWTDQLGNASSAWSDDKTAVFAGTAGTVTVSGTQSIAGLQFITDGYLVTGGTLDVGVNGAQLLADPGVTATIATTLTGTGGIIKTGEGTIILGGTNDYLGGTTINAGTLQISADANLGDAAGGLTINDGTLAVTDDITTSRVITLGGASTFDITGSATFTANGAVVGSGNFDKEGTGTFLFGAAPGYTGGTTIDAGTLDTGNHDLTTTFLAGSSGTLAMGSGNLTVDEDTTTTFSGVITGSGNLTKTGAGLLVLDGVNGFSGSVDVESGTLQAGVAGAFVDNSSYTVNGGTLDLNGNDLTVSSLTGTGGTINLGTATLTVNQDTDTQYDGSINGQYSDSALNNGTLVKTGTGTFTLTGASSIGGPIRVTGGEIDIASGASVSGQYVSIDTGGTMNVEGTVVLNSSMNVGSFGQGTLGISAGGSVTDIDGILSGNSSLVTVDGSGSTWTNSGAVIIGNDNGSSGELDITNGGYVSAAETIVGSGGGSSATLNVSSGGVLETGQVVKGTSPFVPPTAAVTLNGGTLRATEDQPDFLSNFSNGDVTLASGGGTIDTNGNNVGIQAQLSGAGGLTKTGEGTLALSGANDYDGTTTIAQGVLQLGAANAVPTGSAISLTGGTLDVNGFSVVFTQALTVAGADSTLDFGFGHVGGVTLQFGDSSSTTWTSGLDLTDFTVGTDALGFGSDVSGLTLAQLADIDLGGYTAVGLDNGGFVIFDINAVPEPTAAALLPVIFALMSLAVWKRRRQQAGKPA